MKKTELNKTVSSVNECIIEVPLCEVFVEGKSIGFHNEYTVRRIVLAVQRGEISNNVTFLFEGKKHKILKDSNRNYAHIEPNFKSGFYDVSYNLALELMD